MTDAERDLLATRIMGWEVTTSETIMGGKHSYYWTNPNHTDKTLFGFTTALHPDTFLPQAMMLVEAIGKMGDKYQEWFIASICENNFTETITDPLKWFLFHADKPAAIAAAALAVAREIEVSK